MDLKSKKKTADSVKPKLNCSFCNYKTKFREDLYRHISTHTKERPYKCPHQNCNSAFGKKPNLIAHQRIHRKDDESLYKFKCSECPFRTWADSKLKCHLKVHSDFKEFSCDLCPYQSNYKGALKKHQMVHKDKNDDSLNTFKCTECPFKSLRRGDLTQHLMVHSEVKQFKCDLCPYQTKSKGNLNIHNKSVHSTLKPFKCLHPDCNYSCKTASNLTYHMKVHAVGNILSCTFPSCTFTTKWDKSFKRHEMVHREEKPFKCSICHRNFRQMGTLNYHIRGHTGETPFSCPRCPYSAKSSTKLNRHFRSCNLKTNGEIISSKGQKWVKITSFKCKVAACGFLTEKNSSMAVHYNNIHILPRVDLIKMKI